jgi:hypothetical protein
MRKPALTSLENVGPDTPLRLSVAAAIAFPDQTISESSLRREAKRGRLMLRLLQAKRLRRSKRLKGCVADAA